MKRSKTPRYLDRGYGIGRHGWNDHVTDTRNVPMTTVAVQQIIVYDVHGENGTRYNLDTREITGLDVRQPMPETAARWTWAQVLEVVGRDLGGDGRSVGDAYGYYEDSTMFGLYDGKRPRWVSPELWAARKASGSFRDTK